MWSLQSSCPPPQTAGGPGPQVLQHVAEFGSPPHRLRATDLVCQNLAAMSCHKFASNVVEKARARGPNAKSRGILRNVHYALNITEIPWSGPSIPDDFLSTYFQMGTSLRASNRDYAGSLRSNVQLQVLTFGNATGHHRILDSALTITPGEEPPVLRMMKDRCSRDNAAPRDRAAGQALPELLHPEV